MLDVERSEGFIDNFLGLGDTFGFDGFDFGFFLRDEFFILHGFGLLLGSDFNLDLCFYLLRESDLTEKDLIDDDVFGE